MVVLKAKKKFLFICEGACTEPDYIEGIIRNQLCLGIDSIITLSVIPKLKMDCNETDIETLIEIAKDYVQYCRSSGSDISRRLAVTLIFEDACSALLKSSKYQLIKGENRELLNIRSVIDDVLNENNIPVNHLSSEELEKTCDLCRVKFSELFGIEIIKALKPNPLEYEPIFDGDIVCIVHDRDYHSVYFPDEKYRAACEEIARLSDEPVEFRLIITYPKFEFWMLLHSPYVDVRSLDIRKLKDYSKKPGPSKYVDDEVEMCLDVWKEGNKKRIDSDKFDMVLCPNISSAITKSENSKFANDLDRLCSNPGTLMGLLMKEMMTKK